MWLVFFNICILWFATLYQFSLHSHYSVFIQSIIIYENLYSISFNNILLILRYKDERAYPWPGDVSTFILYPEAANQTIYSQVVADTDRGNYTCLMRNDTHIHMHTVILGLVGQYKL